MWDFNTISYHPITWYYINVFNQGLPDDVLSFEGGVDLSTARHVYHIIADYGPDLGKPAHYPTHVYFAKWVGVPVCFILPRR